MLRFVKRAGFDLSAVRTSCAVSILFGFVTIGISSGIEPRLVRSDNFLANRLLPPHLALPFETPAFCRLFQARTSSLNPLMREPVTSRPIRTPWTRFPLGIIDTLFMWAANQAVSHDHRFHGVPFQES
jgi:hypothetical protein